MILRRLRDIRKLELAVLEKIDEPQGINNMQ